MRYMEQIEQLVREAGGMMLHATGITRRDKEGPANFVTQYDTKIQSFLIQALSGLFPGCGFFGEEETEGNVRGKSGYTFYIDPIDGTTNFLFGYRHSCVSVGLAENGRMIAGWVYKPYTDEMYTAQRGSGAFLNGQRLMIRDEGIGNGIVAFGCARYNDTEVQLMFDVVKECFLNSLSIRNGGSAALDLCRIASGSNAAYFELKLQPYDYAASSVIIEEAGGVIGTAEGAPIDLEGPCSIVAGTPTAVG